MMSVVDYEETGSHTDGEDDARVSSEGVASVQQAELDLLIDS